MPTYSVSSTETRIIDRVRRSIVPGDTTKLIEASNPAEAAKQFAEQCKAANSAIVHGPDGTQLFDIHRPVEVHYNNSELTTWDGGSGFVVFLFQVDK